MEGKRGLAWCACLHTRGVCGVCVRPCVLVSVCPQLQTQPSNGRTATAHGSFHIGGASLPGPAPEQPLLPPEGAVQGQRYVPIVE